MELLPGVDLGYSDPTTYTMTYANGQQTYTEVFALLTASPQYMAAVNAEVQALLLQLSAQAVEVPPPFGEVIAGLIEIGGNWLWQQQLNPDGGLTLQLAHHYCGTRFAGVDVTAWPWPNIGWQVWNPIVDGLIATARTGDTVLSPAASGFEAQTRTSFFVGDATDPSAELRSEVQSAPTGTLQEQLQNLQAEEKRTKDQAHALSFLEGELKKRDALTAS